LGPRPTSLIAILSDPPAWNGQEVTLIGEYLGWTPDRFSFATRPGPPVSSGDWVLHNEDGSLYCSPGPRDAAAPVSASLTPVTSPLPALTPYAALGQRFSVTGLIRLSDQAVPYLLFTRLTRPEGAAGLTCRLVLDSLECHPGQRLDYTLLLANPHPTRVALGPPGEWLVTIAAPDGNMFMEKHSFPMQTLSSQGLDGGKEVAIAGAWQVPQGAAAGEYWIVARLSDQLGTYRQCFTVQAPEPGALNDGEVPR
jgi:hypothetical protein